MDTKDIVYRLRLAGTTQAVTVPGAWCHEAADEIERLRTPSVEPTEAAEALINTVRGCRLALKGDGYGAILSALEALDKRLGGSNGR